ncbi:MAG: zinc ribbon domain-containing protein [Planctomycetes bacterium]|nr:zinc ribbon domain-containing protein [Planctomycetota bacterium]
MRIVMAVMRIVVAVMLSIIGSTAIVLGVDHLLFTRGTWSSWQLVVVPVVGHDETAWWKSRVGPLPPAGTTTNIVAPATVRGRDGLNADGAPAPHGARLLYGLIAYRMKTQFPMIRGGVLISPTTHAWRVGVELPGGIAVERIYLGLPGQAPPHPTFGGWDLRILPVGLLINSLYAAAPLCVVVTVLAWFSRWAFRRIRGSIRRAHSRCPACAYVLLPEQNTCPECGYQGG